MSIVARRDVAARRHRAVPAVRLRLLRVQHRPRLLLAAPEPPRPGLRLRHRPRPGRRRARAALVRGGQAARQAQHLHRLRGLRPRARDGPAGRRPDRLVARGGSAGGLLMGAVANLAPELFRAIVAEVPFVDCLTTMLDDTLPLTVIEWEEWGNPVADPEVYAVMKAYAPYDNVRSGRATPTSSSPPGSRTPASGYWEPAKWVQKLRAADPDGRVLLKVGARRRARRARRGATRPGATRPSSWPSCSTPSVSAPDVPAPRVLRRGLEGQVNGDRKPVGNCTGVPSMVTRASLGHRAARPADPRPPTSATAAGARCPSTAPGPSTGRSPAPSTMPRRRWPRCRATTGPRRWRCMPSGPTA